MAARTPGATPSPKNSFGTPMRRPFEVESCRSAAEVLGRQRSSEVESRSRSGPQKADSSSAQSSAERAIGPAWSRLDAKATMP